MNAALLQHAPPWRLMESTKIDIVDFLDSIYIDMELWLKFQKRCHLDEVNAGEILACVITKQIERSLA